MMIRRIASLRLTMTMIGMMMVIVLMGQKDSDVLFSAAGQDVTVSEFKYIYEKNNRDNATYDKESLREYLDLYANFKLKVARAKELGLDQDESYQLELDGYRRKLADSYILDREVNDRLVDQILDRKKYDIRVSHILLPIKRKAPKPVREEAYKRALAAKTKIDAGASFEDVAKELSEDTNSAPAGGDIGYMTAALPDGYVELENAMYTLPVGTISDILQTDLGYHIIKVTDKRPARGRMEAQHILIRKKKFGKEMPGAKRKAEQLLAKVRQNPENFDMMAESLTEDKESQKAKGNLGVFGIGRYEPAFEDAAFALANDGDISDLVETSIGWHVIRRVAKKDPDSRERIQTIVKDKMNTGERFMLQKKAVVEELKKELGYKHYATALSDFKNALDESYLVYSWNVPELENQKIMTIGEQDFMTDDLVRFNKISAKTRLRDHDGDIKALADRMYDEFVQDKVIEYMETKLEDRYPDFRNLIREYKEGILLFEVSKKEIWDRASQDTTGLRQYYKAHRDKYIWQPRAVVDKYTLRTSNNGLVNQVLHEAKTMAPNDLVAKYNTNDEVPLIMHERSTLERSSEVLRSITSFEAGASTIPDVDKKLKASTFSVIAETLPAQHKTLGESRGYVISDYQEQLEEDWIKELRKRYPVKLKNRVLKKLYR